MDIQPNQPIQDDQFDLSFKVFHELMAKKVSDILLVSSPYDAFIMEEEGRLAERIIHEYRGLDLSRPPMLTRVSTAQDAMALLASKPFDLVITVPQVDDTDAAELARTIKSRFPKLPIIRMAHNITSPGISYITISDDGRDFLDWQWLAAAKQVSRTQYLVHTRLDRALIIKVDGRHSRAVVQPKK